ncbi:unnamed protein product [marine sediment metagenome]|uniref:Uncharacterized protein n=1 Tax=marine sediment metagenome TaxID=412755 RepID=X1G4K6_9ZZZZ
MIAPLVKIAKDGTVGIEVGRGLGREWKEDEVLESLSALEEATKSVLHLCHSWLVTKDIAGKRRKGINALYPPDSTAYP